MEAIESGAMMLRDHCQKYRCRMLDPTTLSMIADIVDKYLAK